MIIRIISRSKCRLTPYGYVLHPTIRNKLAVDPEAADVIRRIFREALEGSLQYFLRIELVDT